MRLHPSQTPTVCFITNSDSTGSPLVLLLITIAIIINVQQQMPLVHHLQHHQLLRCPVGNSTNSMMMMMYLPSLYPLVQIKGTSTQSQTHSTSVYSCLPIPMIIAVVFFHHFFLFPPQRFSWSAILQSIRATKERKGRRRSGSRFRRAVALRSERVVVAKQRKSSWRAALARSLCVSRVCSSASVVADFLQRRPQHSTESLQCFYFQTTTFSDRDHLLFCCLF